MAEQVALLVQPPTGPDMVRDGGPNPSPPDQVVAAPQRQNVATPTSAAAQPGNIEQYLLDPQWAGPCGCAWVDPRRP